MGIFRQGLDLKMLLLTIPAVLWAISFHEFCHGYAADLLGDPTAKRQGRLTLNPLAHLDPIGALALLLIGFGWAKPIPINSRYFKNVRRDTLIVSLAGVAGNMLTAFIFGLLLRFTSPYSWSSAALQFVMVMIGINISLAAFNLLPIPPLDGSKVLYSLLPLSRPILNFYFWMERYGTFVLLFLMFTGLIRYVLTPFINVLFRILVGF
jgi:Zn-dependent protease